jgi:hypothetical protein
LNLSFILSANTIKTAPHAVSEINASQLPDEHHQEWSDQEAYYRETPPDQEQVNFSRCHWPAKNYDEKSTPPGDQTDCTPLGHLPAVHTKAGQQRGRDL